MNLSVHFVDVIFAEALTALLIERGHVVEKHNVLSPMGSAPVSRAEAGLVHVPHATDLGILNYTRRLYPELPVAALCTSMDAATYSKIVTMATLGICVTSDALEEVERVLLRIIEGRRCPSRPFHSSKVEEALLRENEPRPSLVEANAVIPGDLVYG